MSVLDKDKQNKTEASEELVRNVDSSSQELTDLENELFADMMDSDGSISFTATWHFELSDILNAMEQSGQKPLAGQPEPAETADPEEPSEAAEPEEPDEEPESVPEQKQELAEQPEQPEAEDTEQPELEVEPAEEAAPEPEPEASEPPVVSEAFEEPAEAEVPEAEAQPAELADSETPVEPETVQTPAVPEEVHPEKPHQNLLDKLKNQDAGTKKLVLTVCVLFIVIAASITAGLVAANALVDKANAANDAKIAEKQSNVKEVNLTESIYNHAADQIIEDIAVPTYTLDELYALDLREPTGFTANDLKLITRRGLVGCEEAFVKAEETYGVNCIFLMSIASLESAYGTIMFRPNNMFGYGRTGFSSKQEGIMTVAKGLGSRYLNPSGSLYGGSPTLKGVNKRYAANPQWYYKVGKYMQGYYEQLAAAKNGALDKFE